MKQSPCPRLDRWRESVAQLLSSYTSIRIKSRSPSPHRHLISKNCLHLCLVLWHHFHCCLHLRRTLFHLGLYFFRDGLKELRIFLKHGHNHLLLLFRSIFELALQKLFRSPFFYISKHRRPLYQNPLKPLKNPFTQISPALDKNVNVC
jgi:hypothetical protein